jgi:hypothetical protein
MVVEMVRVTAHLFAVGDGVGRRVADGVQQRLADVVARRGVEGAVSLDEAQQSRSVIRKAGIAERAVDAVEALQKSQA